ncbi:carbohydrate deacetylase, partial [Bacteroidota bacterium]
MKIIVNADDLGYSSEVNDAIFAFIKSGDVTSATLMANGNAINEAIESLQKYPQASFGIHLNLTEFISLSKSKVMQERGVVDDNGIFTAKIREAAPDKLLKKAIFEELEMQLKKLIDMGVKVSHFDSHHHIHTIQWLFPVIKKLQKKYKIRKVRNTLNLYPENENPGMKSLLMKSIWTLMMKYYYFSRMTNYFSFFEWFIQDGLSEKLTVNKTIELMCHPGSPNYNKES